MLAGEARTVKKQKNDAGSIGDLFTSLGTAPPVLDERFADLKNSLRPSASSLGPAWERLQKAVSIEVAEIKQKGSAIIPVVDFSCISANGGHFSADIAGEVHRRGCVVVRNTLDAEVALDMKRETQEYIASNRQHLNGFPVDNPQVWEVYWSKAQSRMRQHPNMLKTQTALNRLWHCRPSPGTENQVGVDVHRPLVYGERLRIRSAGDKSFTLGPHIDGGSVERWEDDEYRKCYEDILACNWEQYDAWDATNRANAKCDLYNLGVGLCTIFRSFQGWISLSNSGKGKGALMVVPMLRESTAYLMLRPFLDDVPPTSFCGANPGKTQDLYPEFHKAVIDGLVAMPDVGPGDSVWWHCDLIHAVEALHEGAEDSSVYYYPAVPLCAKNAEYVSKQAHHFQQGKTPPDFPPNHSEVDCEGRCGVADLDKEGLQVMGLSGLPDARVNGEPDEDFMASQSLREDCRGIFSGPKSALRAA